MDNLRYFKFVGSKKQANEYEKPRPKVGVIYSEDAEIGINGVFWYATTLHSAIRAEWQEVYVIDYAIGVTVPQTPIKTAIRNACEKLAELEEKYSNNLPQKTFPPDAVTLDTYEGGKWYDVREVLPDERFDKVMFVELYSLENKQVVWDAKDQKFISLTGEVCDDVKEWRANILSK